MQIGAERQQALSTSTTLPSSWASFMADAEQFLLLLLKKGANIELRDTSGRDCLERFVLWSWNMTPLIHFSFHSVLAMLRSTCSPSSFLLMVRMSSTAVVRAVLVSLAKDDSPNF